MNSQKLNLLESSINLIKEKIKAYDIHQSNTEIKFNNLQAKLSIFSHSSSKNQKQNLSGFDNLLSQSQVFTTTLKKVDTNSTTNLRKLEQYLAELINQQQSRFLQIQEKMIGMISQKQKILRNLTLENESHNHSIKAIQEWIKTDHNRGNFFTIMEDNLREKLDVINRNSEMKLQIMNQKIKYFQHLQESTANNRKKYAEDKDILEEEMKNIKKDIKKKFEELEERVQSQRTRKMQGQLQEIPMKMQRTILQLNALKINQENIQNKLNFEIKSIKDMLSPGQINYQQPQMYSRETYQSRKSYGLKEEPLMTSQQKIKNQFNRPKSQEDTHGKFSNKKQIQSSSKKQLPPKKNLFSVQSPPEIEKNSRDMVGGGIKGLLQKSKQKQREEMPRRHDVLSRQKSASKGLPPVREDPFAKKKKDQNIRNKKMESEQQPEEVVYEIDEQGYLMDQQGNYLLNQLGEMIRLSPQEIEQYMDGEGY